MRARKAPTAAERAAAPATTALHLALTETAVNCMGLMSRKAKTRPSACSGHSAVGHATKRSAHEEMAQERAAAVDQP